MNVLIGLLLIAGGLAAIFYLRPKIKNKVTEVQFMKTKTIAELRYMFAQMDSMGLGGDYREYVELKGCADPDASVETPFSERRVAYCESRLKHVTEVRERYRDKDGNMRTSVRQNETTLSDEKSGNELAISDNSGAGKVILEIGGTDCDLDIPETFDRFEPKGNMGRYRSLGAYASYNFGSDSLGFKMTERTIALKQQIYAIGEAYRVGDSIYIGKPMDKKKPFIVTTKSEEELVNSSKQKALFALVGGIIAAIVGIVIMLGGFS